MQMENTSKIRIQITVAFKQFFGISVRMDMLMVTFVAMFWIVLMYIFMHTLLYIL